MNAIQRSGIVLTLMISLCVHAETALAQHRSMGFSPIRNVDFKNFTYDGYSYPDGIRPLILRDGFDGRKIPEDVNAARLESVRFVDLNGDREEEAVVTIYTESSGSGGYSGDFYVFKYRDGSAEQVFHERRSISKPLQIIGRSIIVVAPFWTENDAHCCPSRLERSVYQWRGLAIVRAPHKLSALPKNY